MHSISTSDGSRYEFRSNGIYAIDDEAQRRLTNFSIRIQEPGWMQATGDVRLRYHAGERDGSFDLPGPAERIVNHDRFPLVPRIVEHLDINLDVYGSRREVREAVLAEYKQRVEA